VKRGQKRKVRTGSGYSQLFEGEGRIFATGLAGVERDIQAHFLRLPGEKLEGVFQRYERLYGERDGADVRSAYPSWRGGATKMSGVIAERLLNLVPSALELGQLYEIVRKLRHAHMHKAYKTVNCEAKSWRSVVEPAVADVVKLSRSFELPQLVIDKIRWLACGDARMVQRLLAAAEEEEAKERIFFLNAEFERIDGLLQGVRGEKIITHTIILPQGRIHVNIECPAKGALARIIDLFLRNSL
jgi:hypothetical protein